MNQRQIETNKESLRQLMKKKRKLMTEEQIRLAGEKIFARLIKWPVFKQAGTVMIYLDFRNEVVTENIILYCLENNKSLAVPVISSDKKKMFASWLLNYPEELTLGNWGIREPKQQFIRPAQIRELDLILVPGLAFTADGHRLGYGGGYYDQFLPFKNNKCTTVGLAYDYQLVDKVYAVQHDIALDYILSERGLLRTADKKLINL